MATQPLTNQRVQQLSSCPATRRRQQADCQYSACIVVVFFFPFVPVVDYQSRQQATRKIPSALKTSSKKSLGEWVCKEGPSVLAEPGHAPEVSWHSQISCQHLGCWVPLLPWGVHSEELLLIITELTRSKGNRAAHYWAFLCQHRLRDFFVQTQAIWLYCLFYFILRRQSREAASTLQFSCAAWDAASVLTVRLQQLDWKQASQTMVVWVRLCFIWNGKINIVEYSNFCNKTSRNIV